MRPEVSEILTGVLGAVLTDIAPHLPEGYAQGSMSLIALLMIFASQEYDRAADVRAAENRSLRALFADVGPSLPDPDLRARLAKAARETDESLRVSALNAANAGLKELLIELHVLAEESDAPWASAADEMIWALLAEFTAARHLDMPVM
jgi:hypothetical protein